MEARSEALRVLGKLEEQVFGESDVFVFFFFFVFCLLSLLLLFLGPLPRHMEVPRLGVESEL